MKPSESPFKVFLMLLATVAVLIPLQWLPTFCIGSYETKPVAILSDVLPKPTTPQQQTVELADSIPAVPKAPKVKPALQESRPDSMVCIDDYANDSLRGMTPFYAALSERHTLGRPVRVAYLGDSFIEADILTGELRRMLQERFGGCGVGFLDIDPPYAANRATVRQTAAGWASHCVRNKGKYDRERLNVNQSYYLPQGKAWTEVKGVKMSRLDSAEVHTLYLSSSTATQVELSLNDGPMDTLHTQGTGRAEALSRTAKAGRAKWQVTGVADVTCWGVAEEGTSGVSLDNFSLRGTSGATLSQVPIEQLQAFNAVRPYDLIVLEYGLNVAEKKRLDYSQYARLMKKVVEHMKQGFPQAGILIVGVGDREMKQPDGTLQTMPSIVALSRTQQNLAADCHVAFWDLFEAMGGEGSIKEMAEKKPAEANKDYTHINVRGGKRIASILFKTIIYGYDQYERQKKYEAE